MYYINTKQHTFNFKIYQTSQLYSSIEEYLISLPNCSSEELAEYYEKFKNTQNDDILAKIARHPHCPPHVILQILEKRKQYSNKIIQNAVSNRNCPHEVLTKTIMEEGLNSDITPYAVKNLNCPSNTLLYIAEAIFKKHLNVINDDQYNNTISNIMENIAGNPNCPSEVFNKIFEKITNKFVLKEAIANPSCPIDIIKKIYKEYKNNPNNLILKHDLLENLAKNPKCPPEILNDILLENKNRRACINVVLNPNCPQDTIKNVIKNEEKYDFTIIEAALHNPKCPPEILATTLKKRLTHNYIYITLANPGCPSYALNDFYTKIKKNRDNYYNNKYLVYLVASHPNCPPNVLIDLSRREERKDILKEVIKNTNCPPKALEIILNRFKKDNIAIEAAKNPQCPLISLIKWWYSMDKTYDLEAVKHIFLERLNKANVKELEDVIFLIDLKDIKNPQLKEQILQTKLKKPLTTHPYYTSDVYETIPSDAIETKNSFDLDGFSFDYDQTYKNNFLDDEQDKFHEEGNVKFNLYRYGQQNKTTTNIPSDKKNDNKNIDKNPKNPQANIIVIDKINKEILPQLHDTTKQYILNNINYLILNICLNYTKYIINTLNLDKLSYNITEMQLFLKDIINYIIHKTLEIGNPNVWPRIRNDTTQWRKNLIHFFTKVYKIGSKEIQILKQQNNKLTDREIYNLRKNEIQQKMMTDILPQLAEEIANLTIQKIYRNNFYINTTTQCVNTIINLLTSNSLIIDEIKLKKTLKTLFDYMISKIASNPYISWETINNDQLVKNCLLELETTLSTS